MFETRTVPSFLLLPALLIGAAGVIAWNLAPWGDHTLLKAERVKYQNMRELQHQAAGETIRWKAVFEARGVLLRKAEADGARAVAAAADRSRASNRSAYNAGIVAGRVLERKAHALRNSDPAAAGPDVGHDGVFVDFRELWGSDSAPAAGGEDLSGRGDGRPSG